MGLLVVVVLAQHVKIEVVIIGLLIVVVVVMGNVVVGNVVVGGPEPEAPPPTVVTTGGVPIGALLFRHKVSIKSVYAGHRMEVDLTLVPNGKLKLRKSKFDGRIVTNPVSSSVESVSTFVVFIFSNTSSRADIFLVNIFLKMVGYVCLH